MAATSPDVSRETRVTGGGPGVVELDPQELPDGRPRPSHRLRPSAWPASPLHVVPSCSNEPNHSCLEAGSPPRGEQGSRARRTRDSGRPFGSRRAIRDRAHDPRPLVVRRRHTTTWRGSAAEARPLGSPVSPSTSALAPLHVDHGRIQHSVEVEVELGRTFHLHVVRRHEDVGGRRWLAGVGA